MKRYSKTNLTRLCTMDEIENALKEDNSLLRKKLSLLGLEAIVSVMDGGDEKEIMQSLLQLRNQWIYEKVKETRAKNRKALQGVSPETNKLRKR